MKHLLNQVISHALGNRIGGYNRVIDESATFNPMSEQSSGLHFSEHRSNGRVSQSAGLAEGFVHFGNGSFRTRPKDAHDLQLKVSEPVQFRPCGNHNDLSNTTSVVYV